MEEYKINITHKLDIEEEWDHNDELNIKENYILTKIFDFDIKFIKNNIQVSHFTIDGIEVSKLLKFKKLKDNLFNDNDYCITLDSLNGFCCMKKKNNMLAISICKGGGEICSKFESSFIINDEIIKMLDYIIALLE